MPIVIREVISEIVLDSTQVSDETPADRSPPEVEDIVRRAAARVLEELRREWDR